MSTTGNWNRVEDCSRHGRAVAAAGFTLLELLVVMVLLALLGSMAAPSLQAFIQGDVLRSAARQSIALVQQAGQLARQQQRPYLLVYEEGKHAFVLKPADTVARQGNSHGTGPGRSHSLRLPATVQLTAISVQHSGQSSTTASLYLSSQGYVAPTLIILEAEDGRRLSLVVSPFLGKIKVVEGYVDPTTTALFR
ncbi:MAG: prepilin-type N-terminal cleavage/methylation domain-containing protein [Desulfobulbus sp.]